MFYNKATSFYYKDLLINIVDYFIVEYSVFLRYSVVYAQLLGI
jgi:hypothetical protein